MGVPTLATMPTILNPGPEKLAAKSGPRKNPYNFPLTSTNCQTGPGLLPCKIQPAKTNAYLDQERFKLLIFELKEFLGGGGWHSFLGLVYTNHFRNGFYTEKAIYIFILCIILNV
jgi:hypothetical protein